jgi:hypothetical protein
MNKVTQRTADFHKAELAAGARRLGMPNFESTDEQRLTVEKAAGFGLPHDQICQPVKIIVGQPAGSASNIVARLVAQFLSEKSVASNSSSRSGRAPPATSQPKP